MAVEDGAVLGFLVGAYKQSIETCARENTTCPATASIPAVLKLYENIRKERTTVNVHGAYLNRGFFHLPEGDEQKRRDAEMRDFDFEEGRSEYPWLDTEYNKDLLAYDALEDAREIYERWWEQQYQPQQ